MSTREPITPAQYRYLVGLYKKHGVYQTPPETKHEAAIEIKRLAGARQQQWTRTR